MTTWTCRKCGSKTESYNNKQGTWLSCANEACENYNRMRREEDIDFLEYYQER